MAREGLIIRNKQEKLAVELITKAHKWLEKKLGVDTRLVFARECSWGHDSFHAGFYRNEDKQIRINIRNLYGCNIKQIMEVLGHEFRHAIQYKEKMLAKHPYITRKRIKSADDYISGTWMNKPEYVRYRNAPWEIDAKNYEKKYANMAIKALGIEEQVKTKLPMGTQTIKLKDETINQFRKDNPTAKIFRAYDKNKKSNPLGFCYVKLEQTKYKKWDKQSLRSVWTDYKKLMEKQFVEYQVVKKPFGNIARELLIM